MDHVTNEHSASLRTDTSAVPLYRYIAIHTIISSTGYYLLLLAILSVLCYSWNCSVSYNGIFLPGMQYRYMYIHVATHEIIYYPLDTIYYSQICSVSYNGMIQHGTWLA